jgi:ParB-like chromosome segregation protein Spo0J
MPPKSKKNSSDVLSALFQQAGEGAQIINNGTASQQATDALQVQYLNIQLLRPDPVQPRRILPQDLHEAFHSQRISPNQAIKELVNRAQGRARVAGRPFSNPFDLMASNESEDVADIQYSIEEELLRDLVQLAITLQDDGQVNPLTVVNISEGVMVQYVIETGERRYWSTWLLKDFHPVESHDGKIPCIVIPNDKASPFRQAKENTSRTGLNAIAMARQVALLLLHVHGYDIPLHPVNMDFYRQALELDLRGKREFTADVLSALGGISKSKLSRYKTLLSLSDEVMELADRYNLDEIKLYYIAQLEPEDQLELIQQVIQGGLTTKQVKELVEKGCNVATFSDEDDLFKQLPKAATTLAKLALKPSDDVDANHIAQAFISLERDKAVAKARIRALREMLEEAESYLD